MSRRVHRDLVFGSKPGPDVEAVQRAINQRAEFVNDREGEHVFTLLEVDGDPGRQTLAVGRGVAKALGVKLGKDGLSKYVQRILRNPRLRNPVQFARAARYKPPVPKDPKVTGNTVKGGTKRERVVKAAMQAAHLYYTGQSQRFYSQAGRWTVDVGITGEHPGERSDCSQFVTAMCHSGVVGDPNGNDYKGGYTGTLVAHGREIRRDQLRPGDDILYGPGTAHHVEKWIGNGDGHTSYAQLDRQGSPYRDRTVGHGSPPVDYGDIDMMSGARFFTYPELA